ncbi:MAG TPA: Rossmann-like and DUF2520 domain-containing protein [Pyrinomonadaceae bacterium]|nr:Rossmann-like and DUF2520 domain-containing protein [Pyrinomonadaceae bacterium]
MGGSKRAEQAKANKVDRIVIVGAGRMGTALALALRKTPRYVVAAVAVRRAKRATLQFGLPVVPLTEIPDGDIVIIATPDAAVKEVAGQLLAVYRRFPARRGRVALHLSGALPAEEIAALRKVNFAVGSLHPLISVSEAEAGARRLRGAHFGVEGDARAVRAARRMVREAFAGHSFAIQPRAKTLYHAAAVLSAGHLVALFDVGAGLLKQSGLTTRQAQNLLISLAQSTLHNLASQTPTKSLTGPFARADLDVIARHMRGLRKLPNQQAADTYRVLGQHALTLAIKQGVKKSDAERIAQLLDEI